MQNQNQMMRFMPHNQLTLFINNQNINHRLESLSK